MPAAGVGGGVGPFALQSLDESFGFAVGAGPVGLGAAVLDAELGDGGAAHEGPGAGSVVGHDLAHVAAVGPDPAHGAAQERDAGRALLVREDLDVRESSAV